MCISEPLRADSHPLFGPGVAFDMRRFNKIAHRDHQAVLRLKFVLASFQAIDTDNDAVQAIDTDNDAEL